MHHPGSNTQQSRAGKKLFMPVVGQYQPAAQGVGEDEPPVYYNPAGQPTAAPKLEAAGQYEPAANRPDRPYV